VGVRIRYEYGTNSNGANTAQICAADVFIAGETMVLGDLTITYLFLGGAGSGALFILIVLSLLTPRASWGDSSAHYAPQPAFQPLFFFGYQVGGGALILSALCLLFDLGRPDRLLSLFFRPSPSYLALGTYALVILIACAIVFCFIWGAPYMRPPRWVMRVAEALGLSAALITMLYTGLLFQSIGAGTLLGTVLVPVIFVLSSLSAGVALLLLTAALTRAGKLFSTTFRRLARADAALILLEGVGLVLLLISGFDGQQTRVAATELIFGEFAAVFWIGVVGCGIIAPLGIEGVSLRVGANGMNRAVRWEYAFAPAALFLLIGGYCLRVSLLGAGLPVFMAATTLGAV
jgi:formate-dependent nitrite reductase membrane component NrfD